MAPRAVVKDVYPKTRHSLPSVMMRSGTSKGLFLHREYLPIAENEWSDILLSVMGSREGDNKQIDGVGGATSTTSKVAVVSKSSRPDADVDYTFVQVAVGQQKVDFTGNCGNMASGVGPFALDEGLVEAAPGQHQLDVRVFNTNTQRLLVETIEVGSDGRFNEVGDCRIGGVVGTGSEIKVAFVEPAGSMTGKLFPSGAKQNTLEINSIPSLGKFSVRTSLVDAANPFIFVDRATLPPLYHNLDPSSTEALDIIEAIRREGAVAMGLAKSVEDAALTRGTPKIAVLAPPLIGVESDGKNHQLPDIRVTSFSMGRVHPTLQLTGAVCLSAAVSVEGTIAHELSKMSSWPTPPDTPPNEPESNEDILEEEYTERTVRIRHSNGEITADVKMLGDKVESVSVSRTARRLFEGNVLFNL